MNLFTLLLISFIIISVFGTLLHFTHNWFKNGFLLHIFSALNESSWEHMKMLVAPTLIAMVIQYFALSTKYTNLFNSILIFYIVELVSVPVIYEVLMQIFKKVPFQISIAIFYIAIFLGLLSEYIFLAKDIVLLSEQWSLIGIGLITLCFVIFTYFPPHLPLFRDPVRGGYGHP